MQGKNLGFAKGHRRSVEGVSKVEHRSARWGQWVICGVEVGPGQPAGQVGLEPLHLLLLLLEEQLCSSQTFISCPLILPTGRRDEDGWWQNSPILSKICVMSQYVVTCKTQCVYTHRRHQILADVFSLGHQGKTVLCAAVQLVSIA